MKCSSNRGGPNTGFAGEFRHQPFEPGARRLLLAQAAQSGQFAPAVASGRMSVLVSNKRGPLESATFDRVGATRVKMASRWRRKRTWNITLQQLPLPPGVRPRDGDRRKQRAGIGVPWIGEQFVRGCSLDDATEIHDRDPVGDVLDHGKVVRNEDVSQGKALAKAGEQIE